MTRLVRKNADVFPADERETEDRDVLLFSGRLAGKYLRGAIARGRRRFTTPTDESGYRAPLEAASPRLASRRQASALFCNALAYNVNYRGNRNEDTPAYTWCIPIDKQIPRDRGRRIVKYARSEEERNLSISGRRGAGGSAEINNGGTKKKREREREREEVIILPRGMNNLHSLEFK